MALVEALQKKLMAFTLQDLVSSGAWCWGFFPPSPTAPPVGGGSVDKQFSPTGN